MQQELAAHEALQAGAAQDRDQLLVERAMQHLNAHSVSAATLKRFFKEDGRVRLQPENDALEPIYAAHVQILGKVIGVFRQL